MKTHIVLASQSKSRAAMLRNAGLDPVLEPARIDETAILQSLIAERASPRDMADTLAEMKARKVAAKFPQALTIGCDQVLALGAHVFEAPRSQAEAADHLRQLSGQPHQLLSAAVIYEDGKPVWRHVSVARLRMTDLSDAFIAQYIADHWHAIRHCVGCYEIEGAGARLFASVQGDPFTIMGLPLIEMLNYLRLRGDLKT